jgi:hypothetical protein
MNAFYEHHQDSIRFGYRCFDRILLNGLIQPFQQPERVIGFFNTLPEPVPGEPPSPTRHRRPVPRVGQEPLPEVERSDPRRSARPARRVC